MTKVSAFVGKSMTWLKRVLTMDDADKGRDLASYMPHVFDDWAAATGHYEFDEDDPEEVAEAEELAMLEDYERAEKVLEDDRTAAAFYNYASRHRDVHYDPYSPPHIHMDYSGIVKRDWLIHFTDDAHSIAENGFQYGVDDLNKLGLSTHFKERKAQGGFNFAYRLKDFVKHGKSGYGSADWKYGKEAVVFQASGILVYHHGDQEPQVIFDGKTAKNIIPLVDGYDGWEVQSKKTSETLFVNEDLGRVTDWVVDNFRQYRRPLVGSSNKAALDAFMDELWEDSHPHPFERGARIIHNTWVELRPFAGKIHFSFMITLEPRKGHAKKAMEYLTGLADKHNIKMSLFAKKVGDTPTAMSTEQLAKFYQRYGFKKTGGQNYFSMVGAEDDEDGIEMERKPMRPKRTPLVLRQGHRVIEMERKPKRSRTTAASIQAAIDALTPRPR